MLKWCLMILQHFLLFYCSDVVNYIQYVIMSYYIFKHSLMLLRLYAGLLICTSLVQQFLFTAPYVFWIFYFWLCSVFCLQCWNLNFLREHLLCHWISLIYNTTSKHSPELYFAGPVLSSVKHPVCDICVLVNFRHLLSLSVFALSTLVISK